MKISSVVGQRLSRIAHRWYKKMVVKTFTRVYCVMSPDRSDIRKLPSLQAIFSTEEKALSYLEKYDAEGYVIYPEIIDEEE